MEVVDASASGVAEGESSPAVIVGRIVGGIAKPSTCRWPASRRVAAKTTGLVPASVVTPSRGSGSSSSTRSRGARLAAKVDALPKVPRAAVPGAAEPEVGDVGRRALAAGVGGRRGATNFDGIYQPVVDQGLQISVPMTVLEYVGEGWHDSKRFAALTESGTLLSLMNVRGHVVHTKLGAWQERWKHVVRRACAVGGSVPLRTVGTKSDVDVPWVRLREDVGYQKALLDVFDVGWTRPDEDPVPMELVKLDEPFEQNWWLTRERVFLDDVDTERRMRLNRGRRYGYFVN